jgi:hypothetical protein
MPHTGSIAMAERLAARIMSRFLRYTLTPASRYDRPLDKFSTLPRYPFTHAMIEHAPDGYGVYGLFEGDELIYVGRATRGMSIKACLAMHLDGVLGVCTAGATHYTWELNQRPNAREIELLDAFGKAQGREPRCQGKTAR